jgi:PhnB protein
MSFSIGSGCCACTARGRKERLVPLWETTGSPVSIHLYVEDADAMFNQAVAAGAKVKRPIAHQFYGDRLGGIEDPFGHTWWISTHKEDVSPEEIEKRAAAASH